MLVEEAVRFLAQVPPFQFLEGPQLRALAEHLTMVFYPKGIAAHHPDGGRQDHHKAQGRQRGSGGGLPGEG